MLLLLAAALTVQVPGAPPLDSIVPKNSHPVLVEGGFRFLEGPAWTRDGRLIFSDILGDTIYELKGGKGEAFIKPSQRAIGNTIDPEGRIVSCHQESRSVTRREKDGSITVLADRFEGKRFNSPDDVVVRSDGMVYFTDPSFGLKPSEKELPFDGVYRVLPGGKPQLLAKGFSKPNGLAFSPDEKLLYINDTIRRQVRIFDVSPSGDLSNERLFAILTGDGPGLPNGMKVDVKGNVYCTGPGGIQIFTPKAKFIGIIYTEQTVTNFCFGGADRRMLYIESPNALYKLRVRIAGRI